MLKIRRKRRKDSTVKIKKFRRFVGDFETTVYKGQVHTEVWASALVEIGTENVAIHHSINETFEYLKAIPDNVIVYYHNLKFDGSFWLSYLLVDLQLRHAYTHLSDNEYEVEWLKDKDMPNNSFKYSISTMGQWYTIIIKINNKFIEIRDSLKLLPFSVEKIGKSFQTKHKKSTMEYTGFRYAGCTITDEEKQYIANDVLVVKEALEIMFQQGHDKLTIGSCCLDEYKRIVGKTDYALLFPDLYAIELDKQYNYPNVDAYIRKSYRGGWCYLVKGKEGKIYHNGITADVNSLYPSVMHSESGNRYPTGKPTFWSGDYIPDKALLSNRYYFIRIKTCIYLKEGMLPFIQIKGSFLYDSTEMLETTDFYNQETGVYHRYYYDSKGNIQDTRREFVLTMTDYELLKKHYDLVDCEIVDGCYFFANTGIFDEYIDNYKKIKQESEGAVRESAKLFLNNLYGKMASSTDSSFKVAYIKDDKSIGFMPVKENKKKPGFIAVGSAITSYAREFTIRHAQQNYHGVDKAGFIYADTDSIHCDISANDLVGLTVHETNFCSWKLEATWDEAIFTRQKTYIEHVIEENLKPVDEPYYNIKCAGMPKRCKDLFEISLRGYEPKEGDKYSEEELEFISKKRELTDFNIGLKVPSKLRPKRIQGGVLLVETTYEMR